MRIIGRKEMYFDSKCERVEDMQNNPKLVESMLTRALVIVR